MFEDRKATHQVVEDKILKKRVAAPARKEKTQARKPNNSCVPVPRSTVFPYYITSQSGSKKVNETHNEQGQFSRIGKLKKQKGYRNLFVLLEPSYKQQSL